jgi:hypothetical protein
MHGQCLYEPRFYLRAAQRHLAGACETPLAIDVAWGFGVDVGRRQVLDAVLREGDRLSRVAVVPGALREDELVRLAEETPGLGVRRLVVVAPVFERAAVRHAASSSSPAIELVTFLPELEEILAWYRPGWPADAFALAEDTVPGDLRVRFLVARPGRDAFGVDPGVPVRSVTDLEMLVRRLPSPPVQVLWVPPCPLVTIDGRRLHGRRHACELGPATGSCDACRSHADQRAALLIERTHLAPAGVVRGCGTVHVYYRPDDGVDQLLVQDARTLGLGPEACSARSIVEVPLPGSLDAAWCMPLRSIPGLAAGLGTEE